MPFEETSQSWVISDTYWKVFDPRLCNILWKRIRMVRRNRLFRTLIYQRSKKVNETTPFGTQSDVYAEGYEWMDHSIYAKNHSDFKDDPRVMVGGSDCPKPYSSSILNISAMSFGSLSKNAVLALNTGAKIGGFAHNTGEGGVSPYHLEPGGDLIWQVGTGYFGCRTKDGNFKERNSYLKPEHPYQSY